MTYTIPDWETDTRVQRDLAGGALLDAGCYCANTIRYLMGDEPLSVQAYQRIHVLRQVDSTFAGTMRFTEDRFAYLVTGMEQPFRHCCEVTGTKGWLWVPNLFAADKAVIVAGGEVRLGRGHFRLDEPVHLADNIWLCGAGRGTKFQVSAGQGLVCTGIVGAVISDLALTAQDKRAAKVGIVLDDCGDCKVRDVFCAGFGQYGIWVMRTGI